jgi:cytoskeletal protein RodZ
MHRRSLFPAAGVVALLAFAPLMGGQPSLWAAESAPEKPTTTTMAEDDSGADADSDSSSTTASTRKGDSSSTTATTAPRSGSGSTSTNCAPPETDRSPAPQVGEPAQTHQAGEAGEVEVERLSETELRIANATPNDGWTHTVTSPSGPRVNVRFNRSGQSPSLIRFAASMDQAGQELHIRVTSCG